MGVIRLWNGDFDDDDDNGDDSDGDDGNDNDDDNGGDSEDDDNCNDGGVMMVIHWRWRYRRWCNTYL